MSNLLDREKQLWKELGAVISERCEIIRKTVQDRFPELPVEVSGAADDSGALCVYLFNVSESDRDEIYKFIQEQEKNAEVVGTFMLLPMTKSVEVTKKYYPRHARNQP